jgi:hypothetical protein
LETANRQFSKRAGAYAGATCCVNWRFCTSKLAAFAEQESLTALDLKTDPLFSAETP